MTGSADAHVGQQIHKRRGQADPSDLSHPSLVRDDEAGTLKSSLDGAIEQARSLREESQLLRCETDFVSWREELLGWRLRSGEMLRRLFEREVANEFLHGARLWNFPPGKWGPRLRDDQKALDDTTELLESLRSSVTGYGRPPRGMKVGD